LPKHRIPLPSIKTTMIIIIVVVYTIVLTSLAVSIIDGNAPIRMPTIGNIITTGYEARGGDIQIINGNPTLNWSTIYVGTSTNRTFILRNKSNVVTTPELDTTNWTFNDTQGNQVDVQYAGNIIVNLTLNPPAPLNPNEETNATITLTVKFDTTFVNDLVNKHVATFSFDIIIQPSQV
jgi:hypothetical protein